MSPMVVSRDFNKFFGLNKSTLRISNSTYERLKLKKTYASAIVGFGGTCYKRCTDS